MRFELIYVDAVYEVFERMAYYGISSNLVVYLTKKLHQGTVASSNNVTNWVGTIWMTPILGAYVADAFLGRYWTFTIASTIYLSVIHSNFFSFFRLKYTLTLHIHSFGVISSYINLLTTSYHILQLL